MAITALYASLLAVLFVLLSVRVIAQRRQARVEIGSGDSAELLRRMRVHANFAEYVPFALVLLALAESMKVPSPLLHMTGLILLAGRVIHAYGLSQTPHNMRMRVYGMMMTFVAIAAAALFCFGFGVVHLIV
jgi:uncharacterized membrane protein YecN with MAPEG domain